MWNRSHLLVRTGESDIESNYPIRGSLCHIKCPSEARDWWTACNNCQWKEVQCSESDPESGQYLLGSGSSLVISPKEVSNNSNIKKISVASIYSKPDSRKKSVVLDHISETYNLLCSKYTDGLYFIIAGDTNYLNLTLLSKLDSIINLSPNMRQVVNEFTRLNPPRMLDPILTTMSKFYQPPICIPPLDPDP